MKDTVGVAECDALYELVEEFLDHCRAEAVGLTDCVHVLFEIQVKEFKDKVEFRVVVDDIKKSMHY